MTDFKNSIEITGRVFKPNRAFTQKGDIITNFDLSVYQGKNSDGSYKPSLWFKCKCMGEYEVKDGSIITVKGRIALDEWKNKKGEVMKTLIIWLDKPVMDSATNWDIGDDTPF